MNIRKTKIVTVGKEPNQKDYVITELPVLLQFKYLPKVDNLFDLTEAELKELICKSISISVDKFDSEFNGKLTSIMTLVREIVDFNYEDVFQELVSEAQDQETLTNL